MLGRRLCYHYTTEAGHVPPPRFERRSSDSKSDVITNYTMGEGQLKDMSRASTDRRSKPTLMRTTLYPRQVVYKVFLNPFDCARMIGFPPIDEVQISISLSRFASSLPSMA